MADRQSWYTSMAKTIRLGMTCALALLPGLAAANETTQISPAYPPAMQFTVLPDGSIQGQQTLAITIQHTDKPNSVLVGCDKIGTITVYANNGNATHIAGWLDFSRHTLCNFTKTVKSVPFTDDNIRAACIGNESHTIQQKVRVDFGNDHNQPVMMNDYATITAHISCPSAQAPARAPGNVRPVNACSLKGNWPVWETAPGRQAAVPFVLTANQGRSDVYQVSAPNNAGVTGSAVVNGYKVTISLQGSGAQMQDFSGSFDRSCSTLHGQAVASEPPVSLTATRSGGSGGYTTQSVHTSRTRPAPAHARHQPSFPTPHVNTRVTPKWSTQLR